MDLLLGASLIKFSPIGVMDMGKTPFQIFGPFEVDGAKIAGKDAKEYLEAFWSERDEECPKLSEANGLYVFSLRNQSNYEPNYVGITKTRNFSKEVFNASNVVKILRYFVPDKGKLCLHLLAKPKDNNVGFFHSDKRSLLFTEMFLLLLCRRKNPDILNIVGHAFLENCGIEGITYPAKGPSTALKTFRNTVAIEKFGLARGKAQKKATAPPTPPLAAPLAAPPTPPPTAQPTIQTQLSK